MFWFILIICVVLFVLFLLFADADLITLTYEAFYRFISPRLPAALAGRSMNGKVVWITGASSGIGEGLAYKLASMQCKLVLSARRKELLDQVKAKCLALAKSSNRDYEEEYILVLPFDMLDTDCHNDMMKVVMTRFDRLDCLVNNAGRSQRSFFKDTSLEVYKALMDLDYHAQVSLIKAVLPQMLSQKSGHLVAISSLAGKLGVAQSSGYSAAKHALNGFFHSIGIELAADGIDVTVACPGPVVSQVIENALCGTLDAPRHNSKYGSSLQLATERCADLLCIALRGRLREVWLSKHPFLLWAYFAQYSPSASLFIASKLFLIVSNRLREKIPVDEKKE